MIDQCQFDDGSDMFYIIGGNNTLKMLVVFRNKFFICFVVMFRQLSRTFVCLTTARRWHVGIHAQVLSTG